MKQKEIKSSDTGATIDSHGKFKFYPVYIHNRKCMCLRDSGCTMIVVHSGMVDEKEYDGQKYTLIKTDGTKRVSN